MQVTDLCRPSPVDSGDRGQINRRIDGLARIRTMCGPLSAAYERRYMRVMEQASLAMQASASVRQAALRELDLLSLELCDE